MQLNEVKAIVTGGASGLGAATARRFAAAGATVFGLDLQAYARIGNKRAAHSLRRRVGTIDGNEQSQPDLALPQDRFKRFSDECRAAPRRHADRYQRMARAAPPQLSTMLSAQIAAK